MSEVQSRPAAPRGRASTRGGRGGYSGRGRTRGSHATNGDKLDTTTAAPIEDEGEVGQLKKQYGDKVTTIKEMFPDWTDEDIVFALQETDGDLMTTVDRITDGQTPKTMLQIQSATPLIATLQRFLLTPLSRFNHTMGRSFEDKERPIQIQSKRCGSWRFYPPHLTSFPRRSSWI
jgi:hypothetical protein